jgi:hypothetical protein
MTDLKELAKQMRCGLYVDYGTDIATAFHAMCEIATTSREPAAVFTAAYGVINTLANIIENSDAQEQAKQVQADTHHCGQDAD